MPPTVTVPAQTARANDQPVQDVPPAHRRHPGTWLLPVAAWLLPNWIYEHASAVHGYNWWNALTRARWDSTHYLSIAQHGYQLHPCADGIGDCGNSGWFPAYPGLIRLVHAAAGGRLSWQGSGVLVAELAGLAALALLWLLLDAHVTPRNVAVLALAALWPGGVYGHGVFPTSLTVAATLAGWWALTRRRWALAGSAGAVAAAAYPIGVLYAPAALLYVLLRREPGRVRAALTVGMLTVSGTLTALVVMWWHTGRADAYLQAQQHFHVHGLHNPATSYATVARTGSVLLAPGVGDYLWPAAKVVHTVGWEMHATLALLLACAVAVGWATVSCRVTPLDLALLGYAALVFAVPLVVGPQITQARSHALMLPAVIVLRHLPWWAVTTLAVGAAALAYRLGVLYVLASIV